MSRQHLSQSVAWLAALLMLTAGCAPQQPFYLFNDGDLSHYKGRAMEIEYPDVDQASSAQSFAPRNPLTLTNPEPDEYVDISLEEVMRIALENSRVMRNLGGVAFGPSGVQGEPSSLTSNPAAASTIYEPALTESDPRFGIEAAHAAYDAVFSASTFWEKNDTPLNTSFNFRGSRQDLGTFQAQLSKQTAPGGLFSVSHNVAYEWNDSPFRAAPAWPSDWNVNFEAEARQPLWQGAGVAFNRIAGPGAIPGFNNGIMIARLRSDISLTDFEAAVRNLVSDVERAYWNLYFAYRSKDAVVAGRDGALRTWTDVQAKLKTGVRGGTTFDEAQARGQYFLFDGLTQQAQTNIFAAEGALRYIMGISASDGRLHRPSDNPRHAPIQLDFNDVYSEALCRSVELRKQKWVIKQRELELITAKNFLLPRLDVVGRYRWLGLGDELIDTGNLNPNAFGSLTSGRFQEWMFGWEFQMPLGFRKEMAGVENARLALARERVVLREQELELEHQLAKVFRDLDLQYQAGITAYNRVLASATEVEVAWALVKSGSSTERIRTATSPLSLLLDAQRRLAEAERDFYRSLVDYNLAITQLHFRKGSLLEYGGIHLAEGPWPAKAYFDAERLARARDSSYYLDYGFTRPGVISRGPYDQQAGDSIPTEGQIPAEFDFHGIPQEDSELPEIVPTPEPETLPLPSGATLFGPPQQRSGTPNSAAETAEIEAKPAVSRLPDANPPGIVGGNATQRSVRPAGAEMDLAAGLSKLAARSTSPTPRPSAERAAVRTPKSGPVQAAGYSTQVDSSPTAASSSQGWSSTGSSGTTHERHANPTAAQADRPASDWQGIQR